MKGKLVAGLAVLVATVVAAAGAASADTAAPIDVAGVFHQGEPGQVVWRAIKPADWNGTLVLDLDFNTWSQAQRDWFLQKGYAIGGIQRTQNQTAYELKKYVDDLVATQQKLVDPGAPEPTRTIAFGASRGGFVARMAVQYRPDVFKGAVAFAGGGAGVIASWLGKADAVWALKTLVDPSSPLAVSDLPDIPAGASYGPNYSQDVALGALVTRARATDAGMARLVLAAAFEQATDWPSGSVEPAADDYLTQGNLIAGSFAFGNPQFVHKEIEVMAGGPMTWNHGVDYRDLLERSGSIDRVRWWYARAGLDLDADLATLNGAPRFSADPAAVARVEQIGTFDGQTGGPVLSIKTIGDSADPVSLDEAYVRTFREAGTSDMLRTAFIHRSGHSSQSLRERLVAFQTLVDRLDSGSWCDTSPAALDARAATVAAGTTLTPAQLGTAEFVEYDVTPALRTWDYTNWGTYFSSYVESLGLGGSAEFVNTLDNMAKHWQRGQVSQACGLLGSFAKKTQQQSGKKLTAAQSSDLGGKAARLVSALGC
jgi:pimeloyl-ACP methyl ester carboxylesterase